MRRGRTAHLAGALTTGLVAGERAEVERAVNAKHRLQRIEGVRRQHAMHSAGNGRRLRSGTLKKASYLRVRHLRVHVDGSGGEHGSDLVELGQLELGRDLERRGGRKAESQELGHGDFNVLRCGISR